MKRRGPGLLGRPTNRLTPRQRDVLQSIANGASVEAGAWRKAWVSRKWPVPP